MNTITLDLTAENLKVLNDLNGLHKLVMAEYPQLPGDTSSPRHQLGVQFRVSLPGDRFAELGKATIRHRGAAEAPVVSEGDQLQLAFRIAAEKRNSVRTANGEERIVTTPVSDGEAQGWIAERLALNGFTPPEVTEANDPIGVGAPHRYGTGKKRFIVRDISVQVTVTDEALANAALRQGLGRGKNYGLGMIMVTS